MTFPTPVPGDQTPVEPGSFAAVQPGPVTVRESQRPKRTMSILNLALGLALLVAIGGVAFAVGRSTAPVAAAGARNLGNGGFQGGGEFPGSGNGNGGRTFGNGGLSVQGSVTAVSADSITIKTANGQSVVISINGNTAYHRQSNANATDVQSGTTVIVRVGRAGGANGGPGSSPAAGSSGQAGALSATDVTVVPGP